MITFQSILLPGFLFDPILHLVPALHALHFQIFWDHMLELAKCLFMCTPRNAIFTFFG